MVTYIKFLNKNPGSYIIAADVPRTRGFHLCCQPSAQGLPAAIRYRPIGLCMPCQRTQCFAGLSSRGFPARLPIDSGALSSSGSLGRRTS